MFAYCGYVTEAVLGGVGDALKQKLAIGDRTPRQSGACSQCSSSRCRT